MTKSIETFQISAEQAEYYESKFVPAIFGEWAPHLVEAGSVSPGQIVLDVACGTGVVARAASERVGNEGRVVGLDLNEAMLGVARRLRPDLEWRQGDAAELPFADGSFDVVLCQAAMMFFPDVGQALREMARVVKARGTVAVQVFGSLESQPGYGPFVTVATRHGGPEAINLLNTYWRLGNLDELIALIESAGLSVTGTRTLEGSARFDSIDEFVAVEVKSTPLIEMITDEVYDQIVEESRRALQSFATEAGTAKIPIVGHLLTARHRT
ncbi:MAG: methyltransferase domain-containing protein [Acidimicrobiia bacterium]